MNDHHSSQQNEARECVLSTRSDDDNNDIIDMSICQYDKVVI